MHNIKSKQFVTLKGRNILNLKEQYKSKLNIPAIPSAKRNPKYIDKTKYKKNKDIELQEIIKRLLNSNKYFLLLLIYKKQQPNYHQKSTIGPILDKSFFISISLTVPENLYSS